MLKAIEIKPDVFWVGGIDWNERNFHGYTTERGSTYTATEHPASECSVEKMYRCRAALHVKLHVGVEVVGDFPARLLRELGDHHDHE